LNILLLESDETFLTRNDPRVKHVRNVLKLGAGDTLRAGIIDGPTGTASIEQIDRSGMQVRFTPDAAIPQSPPARFPASVDLLLGHPRPIVLRRMLRDLCTIGVRHLIVAPTELGERSYLGATMWRDIRPLLVEGAAQSGHTRLMRVTRCEFLEEALSQCAADQLKIVLHPEQGQSLAQALESTPVTGVTLAVGSERGWTARELDVLAGAGFARAGMGDRTLRTETAAAVACWTAISAVVRGQR